MPLVFRNRRRKLRRVLLLTGLIFFWFCLPDQLFNEPSCTVLVDNQNQLLAASIAQDGQYRFPHNGHVPERFAAALIAFEDQDFYSHFGVHIPSMFRALWQNIVAGRVVSGGSTLSMQVVRMSRKNPSRKITEKITEMIRAVRLETRYSKEEILGFYASNAPMGGNVVGVDAAAWRYFGTSADELTWAQSTTLAVLPNAPSLIYPGKNQSRLLRKRNKVLQRLHEQGVIDKLTLELSLAEPLPGDPRPLPQLTPHLLTTVMNGSHRGSYLRTTIDRRTQFDVNKSVARYAKQLANKHIHNCAVLVMDVHTGEVKAYVGNTPGNGHGRHVDVIQAPRSSGSILKPILYSSMLQDGELLPHTLVADIPTRIASYAPTNYDETFSGAVPASLALSRSLNVPAVRMLRSHGVEKFHHRLQQLGFDHVNKSPSHYGLSLILGGAEVSLWELAGAYGSMARTLNNYTLRNGSYEPSDWKQPTFIQDETGTQITQPFEASVLFECLNAMTHVNRPEEESGWEYFSSSRRIAWKTGTSYGYRDAWAVGMDPDHLVAVWVGNADGMGRPGIVGVKAAAPLLFEVFDGLKSAAWFEQPYDEMAEVLICSASGHRAQRYCTEAKKVWIPVMGLKTAPCPYHQLIHTDAPQNYRVHERCAEGELYPTGWFVLPAAEAWYYAELHPEYRPLPPWKVGCSGEELTGPIDLIYPSRETVVSVPVSVDGVRQKVILEAAHQQPNAELFWHLGTHYLGSTKEFHQMEVDVTAGSYELVLSDEAGNRIAQTLEFVDIR